MKTTDRHEKLQQRIIQKLARSSEQLEEQIQKAEQKFADMIAQIRDVHKRGVAFAMFADKTIIGKHIRNNLTQAETWAVDEAVESMSDLTFNCKRLNHFVIGAWDNIGIDDARLDLISGVKAMDRAQTRLIKKAEKGHNARFRAKVKSDEAKDAKLAKLEAKASKKKVRTSCPGVGRLNMAARRAA